MKVLVTGASGFLGRHVLASLRSQGLQAVVLGRNLPAGFDDTEHIALDLLKPQDWTTVMQQAKASHLLHLAWTTEHGKYWSSPLNFDWVHATLSLVQAFCQAGGQRVVIAGTCAEYDWANGYLREDTSACYPSTTYGVAKNATRQLTQALCDLHGISFVWGRVFFPYGPGENARRLIPALISVFRGASPAFGVNAGAFRDLLHVSDVAQAFTTLLTDPTQGSVNICSGQPVQLVRVVELLANACRADPGQILSLTSERPDEPHLLTGDNTKLRAAGWQPGWTLEQGLVTTVEHLH